MNFLKNAARASRYYMSRVRTMVTSVSGFGIKKPDIWSIAEVLIETYNNYIPHMKTRSTLEALEHEERLFAIFSHAAYRFISNNPIKRINEYTLHPELSDEFSVVYTNEKVLGVVTRIVVSFRGTCPKKFDDILTDLFLTFGKEHETDRFKLADEKIRLLHEKFPLVPIVVCGHSLGGAQAIHVSKKYNLPSFTYNPAQGISETYIRDINRFPKVRVFRVVNDPVSCIAGMENVKGITLFPVVSNISMMKNHSLENFLPRTESKLGTVVIDIPEEFDL